MTKYKLGDVCTFINGRAYSQPELLDSGKYKVLRVGNIFDGNHWYYSDMELEEDKYCYEGDLLYSWACTFGPYIWHGPKTIYHYHIWKVKQNDSLVDKSFLYYFLNHQTKGFMGSTHGSTMIHITKENMENFEVLLPSLKEQKKIASVLSALDDKIALNKKMNQKLEAMAKRLYDYWFVQYDFPDKNGHPYKITGGPMTYNPTLKREIPEGWEVKTIGDYLKIGNGRDHSKLADGLYPVYGSGGIMRYVAEYLHDGETVLFPRKGTLNNVMYRNEPLWTVDTMFYTSVLVPHSALFVFYSAKMFDFERLNTGTGVPSMTSDIIKKLPIISPDKHTLEQFDKTVAKLYNQSHHNEKEIVRLTKLRDKLLPLLMNGQVEVK